MASTTGNGNGNGNTVSLKLLVDPKSQKVVFAEAGKDFVDFLFDIVSLPLGTVTRILNTKGVLGCIGNLCNTIQDLDVNYIQQQAAASKETRLLKPMISMDYAASYVPLLLSNMQSRPSTPIIYRCGNKSSDHCLDFVTNDSRSRCPNCRLHMSARTTFVNPPKNALSSWYDVDYVKGVVTYMVMDDLVVKPLSTNSIITLLDKFDIKDVRVLEERVVCMGMVEGVKLLKASVQSETVLTDVFLEKAVK